MAFYRIVVLVAVTLISGSIGYFDKCYCPGKDPFLNRNAPLREKMYQLKTEYSSQNLQVKYRPVLAKPGVPPVMVLDVMFPELTQKEMETLDVTQFAQLLASRQAALEQRQMNLNISAMSRTTTTTTLSTTTTTTTTTIANEGGSNEGSGGSEDGSGDGSGNTAEGSGSDTTTEGSDGSDGSGGTESSEGSGNSDVSSDTGEGSGSADTVDSGNRRRKRSVTNHHHRSRRQISFNEMYDAMLVPENEVKGIQPKGGDLKNAEVCPCGPPAGKLRKEIKLKVAWENDMWDPNSDSFRRVKAEIEGKTNAVLSGSETLLSSGFAGTTVIAIRLESLGSEESFRRKRQASENTTETEDSTGNSTETTVPTTTTPAPTTTTPEPTDLVSVELEIEFGGDRPEDPPKSAVDNKFKKDKNVMEFENLSGSTDAACTWADLQAINPPAFLKASMTENEVIASGLWIWFECDQTLNPGYMIPFESDTDSNYQLEVYCVDGSFLTPNWPSECVEENVCVNPPEPPAESGLSRSDNRTKYRQDELVYYSCGDEKAIVNDGFGLNTFALVCDLSQDLVDFPTDLDWPTCYRELECTDLNDPDKSPSEESRLELSPKTNTSVRAGEYIRYQCIDKALFHETVFGPHIEVFCDVIDGEPTYNTSFTWPICTPLECTCLGDPALTVEQILNITDSSCPSGETIDRLVDVSNKTYPMPKRVNCGTYKPESPNYENKCTCPDLEEPIVYVNEMQILDFTWFAKLGDATTSMFAKRKDIAEVEFDTFYLAQEWMREKKYMRTVVYRFREGNANPLQPGTNYVKVTVEHHFRSDSDVTFEEFEIKHAGYLQLTQGKFSESFSVVPNSLVQQNQTCSAESMARLSADFFVVSGLEYGPVTIGNYIEVTCEREIQKFTRDIWDGNSTDNKLTIICRSDKKFDVPSANDLPECLAQCPAEKPNPPDDSIKLDTERTSVDGLLWEREELWYKCNDTADGIAVTEGNETIGSDARDIGYKCRADGTYDIPTRQGQPQLDRCLPRPKICRCLGDFDRANYSIQALKMMCRNDTWRIMPSIVRNPETGEPLDQVVPNKTRCGSLDPVEMSPDNKCYCYPKEEKGAMAGKVIKFEVLNIPWSDQLLNYTSDVFANAKYIVEEALDLAYIEEHLTFYGGYVRSIVTRFYKGFGELNPMWADLVIQAQNVSNNTNITSLDDFPDGILPGEPIITILQPEFEEGQRGVTEEKYHTTMVEVEVQFRDQVDSFLEDYTKEVIFFSDWISETVWVNESCFGGAFPQCKFESVRECANDALGVVFGFGFTHSNYNDDGTEKDNVLVGSSVNIECSQGYKRPTEDRWDEDPTDFIISALCKPDTNFDMYVDEFPECKAWCPREKAVPPVETNLVIQSIHNNTDEYWEEDELVYICIDPSHGVDASADNFKRYKCKKADPGRYTTPRLNLNETWPICMPKTTTVKPPIKLGLKSLLQTVNAELIKNKTAELYLWNRDKGDANYWLEISIPSLIILLLLSMGCLCCSRNDNPLCPAHSNKKSSA